MTNLRPFRVCPDQGFDLVKSGPAILSGSFQLYLRTVSIFSLVPPPSSGMSRWRVCTVIFPQRPWFWAGSGVNYLNYNFHFDLKYSRLLVRHPGLTTEAKLKVSPLVRTTIEVISFVPGRKIDPPGAEITRQTLGMIK